jgi:acyl-coenzyme A synthetase/AMP-(fatty) acid ligase
VVVSGTDLADFLRRHAISFMILTPSLLDVIPAGEYPALRTVVVGGESCSALTAERWSAGRCFLNVFAPTETTVYTTITSNLVGGGGRVPPMGRAIPNAQVYVLNEQLQPVPVGVVGEIYIGGVGLARGYLRRPALTAERFIPNPFGSVPGVRLYKTGDMARYLPDGNLEFAGRVDSQVKIRGRRIELGEVEAALGGHPGVREACVLIREDVAGEKQLTAYVVPAGARRSAEQAQSPETVSAHGLRRHMQTKLPSFMVPSHFVLLDKLPLTVHGKIDLDAPRQRSRFHCASDARSKTGGAGLARRAAAGAGGHQRQLFRPRRSFVAGDARHLSPAPSLRLGDTAAVVVRAADGGYRSRHHRKHASDRSGR